MHIWGEVEPEISSKAKFAKYHALRIIKAIKAGEDPNLSNPKQEEPRADNRSPTLEPNDPDVQMLDYTATQRQPSVVEVPDDGDYEARYLARQSLLDESLHPSRTSSVPRAPPAKVEDVSDDSERLQHTLAQRSSLNESLHPSHVPSVGRPIHTDISQSPNATKDPDSAVSPLPPSAAEDFYTQSDQPDVSPLAPSPESRPSEGGSYFPQIPSPPSQPSAPPPVNLPSAPTEYKDAYPPPQHSAPFSDPSHAFSPSGPLPPPSVPPPLLQQGHPLPHTQPPPSQPPPPRASNYGPPSRGPPPAQFPISSPANAYPPPQAHPMPSQHTSQVHAPAIEPDEEAVTAAQKHARWAISALNFEDIPTAIRELREALKVLGGE